MMDIGETTTITDHSLAKAIRLWVSLGLAIFHSFIFQHGKVTVIITSPNTKITSGEDTGE